MKAKEFYCEACGNAVSLKASKCPHCGKLFDSVRCPKCEFTGASELFSNGCPVCGYLSSGGKATEGDFITVEKGLVAPDAEGAAIGVPGAKSQATKKKHDRNLPKWLYSALTITLFLALIIIFIVYIRL